MYSGSKSDSFSRFETEGLKTGRTGPIMPIPSSESPRRADSATPPSGPAPVLHSFATSRGPSPLTLGGAEVVPLAVAFQVIYLTRLHVNAKMSMPESQRYS